MKVLIVILVVIPFNFIVAQSSVDLKTLIGKHQKTAMRELDAWGIKVSPSEEYDDLLVGYDEGIQIGIKDSIVNTIWIEFTARRSGAFPFPVDQVITPNVDIKKVISVLGKPHEKEEGFKIDSDQSGWVKWNTKAYQLHCQVQDSEIFMVTIMEPDWYPGKE